MTRRRFAGLIVAGVSATAAGIMLAVVGVTPTEPGTDPGWFPWLVTLVGLVAGAWLLLTSPGSGSGEQALPWSPSDPIVEGRPEATPGRQRLTGGELVEALREAGAVARDRRDVDEGVAAVRPVLRDLYRELRERDRRVDDPVGELDAGTWTDDPVAASVLSGEVSPPPESLGRRLRDWLYPGRAVARRVRRAVDELAALGDDAVPPVVGQSAPRQVPVHEPSLAARTVDVGGEFPRAALDEDGSTRVETDRSETGRDASTEASRSGDEVTGP